MAAHNQDQTYHAPQIERIELDNEISLILVSAPPDGPTETLNTPEYLNNDPFRTDSA